MWWSSKKPQPSVNAAAQPLVVGESTPDGRIIGRLQRLYLWMEQRPDAPEEKRREIAERIDRLRYTLAGRGYPLCENRADAEALSDGSRNA